MQVFPVSSSILSAVHIAGFVKDNYTTGATVNARVLKTGVNHSYLIEASGNKFIFRVYSFQWRTAAEIAAEIQLLQRLHENGIPVSYAIADKRGEYIQILHAPEGARYAVLFSFAKGDKMLQMPASVHYTVGEVMARIHHITQDLRIERVVYTPDVVLIDSFAKLGAFLPADTDEMQYMHRLQSYLLQTLQGAGDKFVRKGVVHLDIWFDNMVIDTDGAITLFDFDFCGNGLLLLDIAYYMLQLYSTEKEEAEFNQKQAQFLEGYESVAAINAEEKKLIPAAAASLYFFYLGIQCSRFDNWSNNFLNDIYLKRFINLLVKRWANHHHLAVE